MTTAKQTVPSCPVITATEVDLSDGTAVISAVQKFVVPVPAFSDGGEPLVYPEGHELAGTPVLAYNDSPVGEKGIVFWNAADSCWQAAAGDGSHVVIINEVSEEQAEQLHRQFMELGTIESITLQQFRHFLDFAASIGLTDVYQSDIDYAREHLSPLMSSSLQVAHGGVTMGFVKCDGRDIAFACYADRPFEFINTAGVHQEMHNGGVIVRLGEDIHAVQPDIFQHTFRLAEHGKAIEDLARDISKLVLNGKTTQ